MPTAPRDDYYRILQVDRDAHPEIIRAAYRTLLKELGKHPDHGGDDAEAGTIIEAYATLAHPGRRRAYDQWIRAHGAGAAKAPVAEAVSPLAWLRTLLPEHVVAAHAPFARSFDLVLEAPGLLAPRLYVKTAPHIVRDQWATLYVLCRAVAVARRGVLPSTDTVLLVGDEIDDTPAFVARARAQSRAWAWNRTLVAVATLVPCRLYVPTHTLVPRALRRIVHAFTDGRARALGVARRA